MRLILMAAIAAFFMSGCAVLGEAFDYLGMKRGQFAKAEFADAIDRACSANMDEVISKYGNDADDWKAFLRTCRYGQGDKDLPSNVER